MDQITIVQHNVLHWDTRKFNLTNTYRDINPHIILLNSHGMKNQENIKIHGYTTYQLNTFNELSDGCAILVKSQIKHKLDDNYITDFLDISIETDTGPINIATTYLPPRRAYLPFPDFHRFATKNNPAYLIGDLNATSINLGNKKNNQVGKNLNRFLTQGTLIHHGPNFPTFHSHHAQSTPDIVLSNNKIIHNLTLTQGPITLSDHTPIIMTLTTKGTKIA